MDNLWYKNAIIYSLDIETFMDSNNDGVGDIKGLKHRLEYLSNLGITCIWLLPFYDSPNKDNGYDVRDYFQVNPKYGDLGHFAELVDTASELGIRIIVDLVVNHTSNKHPWFKEARKDKNSRYRDFYIWMDKKPKEGDKNVIFGKHQGNSNWEYDKKAEAYFYHTFYPFQPDLNISNPAVQKEIERIMHFWLKLGVSGFRIDAASHMIREKGKEKFDGDPHQVFRNFRTFIETQRLDAILLAEVDVDPKEYKDFFGEEDQMNLLLNFYINNYIFLALAREKAEPLSKALDKLSRFSKKEQMANFIRNHDELDLERLSESERKEVFKVFAPKKEMRIFNRGIRRRLPPMLGNNRQKMELTYSLLFTLPGTPILRYGQEIGMGDDLSIEGRGSVRTIMQWSKEAKGGFTDATNKRLAKKLISKGEYSYKTLNVEKQRRDQDSLLNWIRRAIYYRREAPEFGSGQYELLKVNNPKVLAHGCTRGKHLSVALHNFSNSEEKVKLKIKDSEHITAIFGDKDYGDFNTKSQEITLSPYGYLWLGKRKIFYEGE